MIRSLLVLCLLVPGGWALSGVDAEQSASQPVTDQASRLAPFVFPHMIREMLQWPSQQIIDRRFIPTQKYFFARDNSIEWIKKLIRREWLPPDLTPGMIFIKDQYSFGRGRASASHVRWETSGYSIQVAQTRHVIVFLVTPTESKTRKETRSERIEYAKGVVLQLIPDEYVAEMGGKRHAFSNLYR